MKKSALLFVFAVVPFIVSAQTSISGLYAKAGWNNIKMKSKYFDVESSGGSTFGFMGNFISFNDDDRATSTFFLEWDYSKRESDAKGFVRKDSISFTPYTYNYTYHKMQLALGFDAYIVPGILSFQAALKLGSITISGKKNEEKRPIYLSKNAADPTKDYIDANKFDEKLNDLGWIITPIPPFFVPTSYDLLLGIGFGNGRILGNVRYNIGLTNLHRNTDKDKKVWERGLEINLMVRLYSNKD